MSTEQLGLYFTKMRLCTVLVEEASFHVGFVSCLLCGGCITVDPADDINTPALHLNYHRSRGELG